MHKILMLIPEKGGPAHYVVLTRSFRKALREWLYRFTIVMITATLFFVAGAALPGLGTFVALTLCWCFVASVILKQ